jgi:hypothetical protein
MLSRYGKNYRFGARPELTVIELTGGPGPAGR